MTNIAKRNLNLHTNYVKNWGAWEVLREIVANALDADKKNMKVEVLSDDVAIITTTTSPELWQLLHMGGGTKGDGSDIGMFGEGFKLAALTVTRAGGVITAACKLGTMRFTLEDDLGQKVLHATLDEEATFPGCCIRIQLMGIGLIDINTRIRRNLPLGPIDKIGESMQMYVKGMWIGELQRHSIYDWNTDTTLNRDRNRVGEQEYARDVLSWSLEYADQSYYENLMQDWDCYEWSVFIYRDWNEYAADPERVVRAFQSEYGQDAIISSRHNEFEEYALSMNVKVVRVNGPAYDFLLTCGVTTAYNMLQSVGEWEMIPTCSRSHEVVEVLKQLELPYQSIRFCKHRVNPKALQCTYNGATLTLSISVFDQPQWKGWLAYNALKSRQEIIPYLDKALS